jgi:hypothetical protein
LNKIETKIKFLKDQYEDTLLERDRIDDKKQQINE